MGKAEEPRARTAWPRFLQGDGVEEIAARLSQGDAMELAARSARRLRERWILLEPERVHHRVLAVCARAAAAEDPPEDIGAWASAKIDRAIEQLVRADLEAERAHPELVDDEDGKFALLTECLAMEPSLVRAASSAFNALEDLPRRAFFELMIEGKEVPEVIEAGPWDEDGLYQAIHTALAALGLDGSDSSADDHAAGRKP